MLKGIKNPSSCMPNFTNVAAVSHLAKPLFQVTEAVLFHLFNVVFRIIFYTVTLGKC